MICFSASEQFTCDRDHRSHKPEQRKGNVLHEFLQQLVFGAKLVVGLMHLYDDSRFFLRRFSNDLSRLDPLNLIDRNIKRAAKGGDSDV